MFLRENGPQSPEDIKILSVVIIASQLGTRRILPTSECLHGVIIMVFILHPFLLLLKIILSLSVLKMEWLSEQVRPCELIPSECGMARMGKSPLKNIAMRMERDVSTQAAWVEAAVEPAIGMLPEPMSTIIIPEISP